MEIEQRVNDQIEWNDRKSKINKRCYYLFASISVVGSIIVSILIKQFPLLTAYLSIIVAIVTVLNNVYEFQNKWKLYRNTAERLIRERSLFYNEVDIYKGKPKDIYTKNIEQIISESNEIWVKVVSEGNKK